MTPTSQLAPGEDPRYENCEYKEQQAELTLVRDVYAGSRQIKSKSTEYLPQEPKESHKAYEIRLKRSCWWNGYRKTVLALVGMVFRKAPVIEDAPAEIEAILDNIDLQGNHLDVFVKDRFREAFDGHSFILVDMARPLDPAVATKADEVGRRPYWCPRKKEQVINWVEGTNAKGHIVLTQVTIKECVKEQDGRFGESEIEQWRVLALENGILVWEIWRERTDEQGAKEVFISDMGSVPLIDFIPLVFLPTNATGFMCSSPPLVDLADLNVSHYQLWSDIKNILHRCYVPILAFFGRSEDDREVEIGPNAGVDMPTDGRLEYVEPTGAAIKTGLDELEDTERRMGVMGLELLAPRSDVEVTATQSAIDDSSQISELGGMVEALDNAINQALWMTARFLGLDAGGTFKANKDFNRLKLDSAMLGAISNQVIAGQLSLETLWWQMERGELLPPGFDPELEKQRIGEQALLTPQPAPIVDPALAA